MTGKNCECYIRARAEEIVVMELQLKGKVALVTGSTAGIGFAIASSLAGEGATVIINGRSEKRIGDAITTIRQKHPQARLETCTGDLSTAATVLSASPINLPTSIF
jgi:NAD(P)-dependent dehydrogenase (short-subunit alcohol dehydrogenase family)